MSNKSALIVLVCSLILVFAVFSKADRSGEESNQFAADESAAPENAPTFSSVSINPVSSPGSREGSDSSALESYKKQSVSLPIQGLTGVHLGDYESVLQKYEALERRAASDPAKSYEAATIREACSFLAPNVAETEMAAPVELLSFVNECRQIEETSVFDTWELIEFAAQNGVSEAVLKQPSYPPKLSEDESARAQSEHMAWQETVLIRVQSLADAGNRQALLRYAQLLSGEFAIYEDAELARYYLGKFMEDPGADVYENAVASRLWNRLHD